MTLNAKNLRIIAALIVSVYGVLSAADHQNGLHLPTAVSAILTAAAPLMLALQHYLSDPSTGTPTPVPGSLVNTLPEIAPPGMVVVPNSEIIAGTSPYIRMNPNVPVSAPEPASPAPAPPPEWATMGASAAPNPAPPAPQ